MNSVGRGRYKTLLFRLELGYSIDILQRVLVIIIQSTNKSLENHLYSIITESMTHSEHQLIIAPPINSFLPGS